MISDRKHAVSKTPRGFANYGTIKDSYGSTLTVRESSAACIAAVWIFTKNRDGVDAYEHLGKLTAVAPHLTPVQAKRLIKALQRFIADAEEAK